MNTPKSNPIPPVNRRGEVDVIEPDFDIIWQDMSISGYIDMIADNLVEDIEIDLMIDELADQGDEFDDEFNMESILSER